MKKQAFEMSNITKTFLDGKIIANDKVSFSGNYGDVIGLIGENGAGKSTLMSVLFGLYTPNSGKIKIEGEEVKISSPLTAAKLGIGMVPQHFKLVGNMTVTENVMLGVEKTKYGLLDRKTIKNEIIEISKKYGLQIDPDAKVSSLNISQKQRVEIIKTLFKKSKIIVLDEPTSVLTPQESDQLLEIVENFKKDNKLVVFISHKLREIMAVSNKIVVMRKGKVTGDILTSKATIKKLSEMMVGESVDMKFMKSISKEQELAYRLEGVSLKKHGILKVKPFSLDIYKGEIIALVGIDGNGHTEVAKMIAGQIKPTEGTIIDNLYLKNDISKKYLGGMGYVPEERQVEAVALDLSFKDNMTFNRLDNYSKFGFINNKKTIKFTKNIIKKYDVRGAENINASFRGLSGGNQQKAVNGREIDYATKSLIAINPTRGVDIGAIKNIYIEMIKRTTSKQLATVLLTGELDEVVSVANRIAVFSQGELMGVTDPKKVTRNQIGLMMTGTKLEELKGVKND